MFSHSEVFLTLQFAVIIKVGKYDNRTRRQGAVAGGVCPGTPQQKYELALDNAQTNVLEIQNDLNPRCLIQHTLGLVAPYSQFPCDMTSVCSGSDGAAEVL